MHIHEIAMSLNEANFYAASQSEKAEAARRAANVRKKLLKSAAEGEDLVSPEESLLISHWLDPRYNRARSEK
jgi:hypothetical protein